MENVWMVRAGEGGYLAEDFAKGFVAVGWAKLGDMTNNSAQEVIRQKYLAAYPEAKPGEIGNQVAMFYKFRTVMQKNENVITYDPQAREYLVKSGIMRMYEKLGGRGG
jgi:restriction system protein